MQVGTHGAEPPSDTGTDGEADEDPLPLISVTSDDFSKGAAPSKDLRTTEKEDSGVFGKQVDSNPAMTLESPHTLTHSFADRESLMDLLDDVLSENASMSGYSAYSAKRDDTEPVNYYVRLVKFYQKYNSEKLNRVEEFLAAYKGEEEQLFQILREKYGPEPECSQAERDEIASDYGGLSRRASMMNHPRKLLPKVVPPQEGFTDAPTPYWPGTKAVRDTDLLELLLSGATDNRFLAACFVGIVTEHPRQAWNGLTYLSNDVVPGGSWLGHHWSGSLANNKALVYKGTTFDRCVLHCSEQCRKGEGSTPHERWRLTMYSRHVAPNAAPTSEHMVLYRTVWDAEVEPDHSDVKSEYSAADESEGASKVQRQNSGSGGLFSGFGFSRRRPPPPQQPLQPVQPVQPMARAPSPEATTSTTASSPPEADAQPPQYRQPHQPQPVSAVDTFVSHLEALEKRINERLDRFEVRISTLEGEMRELRQGANGGGSGTPRPFQQNGHSPSP